MGFIHRIHGIHDINVPTSAAGQPYIVAIGNFDGVHQGHQLLLRTVQDLQKHQPHYKTAVLSFHPHPRKILDAGHHSIYALRDYVTHLQRWVDDLWLAYFAKIRYASGEDFVRFLAQSYVRHIVIGEDFRCGYQRGSDALAVQTYAQAWGIQVHIVPFLHRLTQLHKISSRDIRHLLQKGELVQANQDLGHFFSYSARCQSGRQLGRQLSFPTINLPVAKDFLLPWGVYAVYVHVFGQRYAAVANLGNKPSVHDARVQLEVHALHASLPYVYGYRARVEFVQYLRAQAKFDDLTQLQQAITLDIAQAEMILNHEDIFTTSTAPNAD